MSDAFRPKSVRHFLFRLDRSLSFWLRDRLRRRRIRQELHPLERIARVLLGLRIVGCHAFQALHFQKVTNQLGKQLRKFVHHHMGADGLPDRSPLLLTVFHLLEQVPERHNIRPHVRIGVRAHGGSERVGGVALTEKESPCHLIPSRLAISHIPHGSLDSPACGGVGKVQRLSAIVAPQGILPIEHPRRIVACPNKRLAFLHQQGGQQGPRLWVVGLPLEQGRKQLLIKAKLNPHPKPISFSPNLRHHPDVGRGKYDGAIFHTHDVLEDVLVRRHGAIRLRIACLEIRNDASQKGLQIVEDLLLSRGEGGRLCLSHRLSRHRRRGSRRRG